MEILRNYNRLGHQGLVTLTHKDNKYLTQDYIGSIVNAEGNTVYGVE
jgi:hypothetical protein